MARRPRSKIPGYPIHALQRGVNKAPCFFVQRDYELYLALLDELAPLFGCAIHAYALMTNHVHLLLTPGEPGNVSVLMKHLNQRYVQYVNRKHGRCGTLWQGRFKGCLIDSEAYLMECYRYVDLNPVRAGLVTSPELYPWSSYRTNALGKPSTIVVPHERYLALARADEDRLGAYERLCADAMCADTLKAIRSAVNSGTALGSRAFLWHLKNGGQPQATYGKVGRRGGSATTRSATRKIGV